MIMTAEYLIAKLNLQKHPEGGYYSEVYRSDETIEKDHLPGRYNGKRSFSTLIYFLLKGDDFSAFHRINSDEIWHFYAGASLSVHIINDDGIMEKIVLGNNPENNESFFALIKKSNGLPQKQINLILSLWWVALSLQDLILRILNLVTAGV